MSNTSGHVAGKESELGDELGEDATTKKIGKMESAMDFVRYHIVPPVFLVVFTGSVQLLAIMGRDEPVSWTPMATAALGNIFSWSAVLIFILWAFLGLKISNGEVVGPTTLFNFTPTYKTNGVVYYLATMLLLLLSEMLCPHFCQHIFTNIPEILGTLNIVALLFCCYLFIKGKFFAEHMNDKPKALPMLYEFYRGMELHPRMLGVDVKQLTNSRIGVMAWQILVLVFYITSTQRNGFNVPTAVTFLLQTIYLAKFFWWEVGYFSTLDIIMDRAGYYICWGCLVWVPCFYTLTSYYFVLHVPIIPDWVAVIIAIIGIAAIFFNYRVDHEKQKFRNAPDGSCTIWGRQARFITAWYKDHNGTVHTSRLLTSGFWGIARHANYTFELLSALMWSLPGLGLGPFPFLYVIFLTYLLVHRCFRDEDKCKKKYGRFWEEYCRAVQYRMIPHVF